MAPQKNIIVFNSYSDIYRKLVIFYEGLVIFEIDAIIMPIS
jgi:hypothetical protein